jgi:hypothetical protein
MARGVPLFHDFRNVEPQQTFPEHFGFVSTDVDQSDGQIEIYDTDFRILSDPNREIFTINNDD